MDGRVVALYIARAAGAPMLALSTVHLVPARGIVGDRFYARRRSDTNAGQSDVTLVEQEALDSLVGTGTAGDPGASARRNIVIRGYPLHQLVGQRFRLGNVTLYGLAPHLTCASPQTTQQDACAALTGTTLWAQILTEGDITLGDQLRALAEVERTHTESRGDLR
jgi:MOSC domain-containing protein YiiM